MNPSIALISAGAALLGVVLGQLFARSSEYRKWLRAEQYSVCLEFLKVVERMHVRAQTQHSVREMVRATKLGGPIHQAMRDVAAARVKEATGQSPDDTTLQEAVGKIADDKGTVTEIAHTAITHLFGETEAASTGPFVQVENLTQAEESIQLLCSPKVIDQAGNLRSAIIAMSFAPEDEQEKRSETYDSARKEFIVTARKMMLRRWSRQPA